MYCSLSRAVLVVVCSPVQKGCCGALVSPRAAVWLWPVLQGGFICCPSLDSLETTPCVFYLCIPEALIGVQCCAVTLCSSLVPTSLSCGSNKVFCRRTMIHCHLLSAAAVINALLWVVVAGDFWVCFPFFFLFTFLMDKHFMGQ